MSERRYRILFVRPAVDFSVSDVARGYLRALRAEGHDVREYDMAKRYAYHAEAMGEKARGNVEPVSRMASETILVEAMYHNADLVVIVSGLVTHPIALHLLKMARIPTVVLHTESPYEDDAQAEWNSANPDALVATHERTSADARGWLYLPHAYDPAIHRPRSEVSAVNYAGVTVRLFDNGAPQHDVVFVGTGWQERIDLFEAVDWTGIDLKLYGLWPLLRVDSPLRAFYVEGCVDNTQAVDLYRASRLGVNLHRHGAGAVSLNPRAFELAACGVPTLTDRRDEGVEIFARTMPVFETAKELGDLVRMYLADESARKALAHQSRERVMEHTFATRVRTMLDAVDKKWAARAA